MPLQNPDPYLEDEGDLRSRLIIGRTWVCIWFVGVMQSSYADQQEGV